MVTVLKLLICPRFVAEGNRVNLGSATIAFTKSIVGFLEDGLRVNTPEASTDSNIVSEAIVAM